MLFCGEFAFLAIYAFLRKFLGPKIAVAYFFDKCLGPWAGQCTRVPEGLIYKLKWQIQPPLNIEYIH